MKKFKLLYLITVFTSIVSFSQNNNQLSIGLENNSFYYLDDDVTGDFLENDNFRSNTYIKTEYRLNDFEFGLQIEAYAPQAILNYSPNFDDKINIGTYYAKYTKKKFDITLGYFYEQFGSGLILRSWEDRQLGINNALRGARINYRPSNKVAITALFGNQRIGFDVSDGNVFGLNTNFDLSTEKTSLQFGLSYVSRQQDAVDSNSELASKDITHLFSGRVNYAKNNIYANIEGVLKTEDALGEAQVVHEDFLFFGNALLLELGYSKKGLGFSTSLRRLENMNFYSNREAVGNDFNEAIINFIPSLTKQHDYSLANINVYQAQSSLIIADDQKSGEIGLQMDLFYKFKKETSLGGKYGTKIALNYANWYGLEAQYNPDFKRVEVEFLDFGNRYFTEFSLEVRKKLSSKTKMIFTYINSYYNKGEIVGGEGIYKSNIGVVELSQKLANKKSLRFEAQHLWIKKDMQNWLAGTTEFNFNSHFSIFGTDMYNYGNNDKDERNHFYNFGGSYTKNRSRFAISYGRQRGGLLCVGGVCRVVSPATGFSFSINTSF